MGKRIVAAAAAILIALVMFAGCAPKEDGNTKLVLSEVTHSVFYAPQYAALELGFFEEEGLEIELINGEGADKVMTSVITGAADIGLAGPEASIYVYQEGKEDYAQIFAQLTKRDGSFLVGREPDDNFSYDKLKGKYVIGGRAGGVPLMTLEYVFKEQGLDLSELTVDSSVQFAAMAGAFTGGTGDYVTLFEPVASALEAEGKGYVVASIGEDSGEIPYTAYFASKSFIDENPEIIDKFTRAVYKGQQWIANAEPREIAEVIAPHFADSDIELLTKVAERYKSIDAWMTDPLMKKEALTKLQDVMQEAGELDERVPFEALVRTEFAEKVIAE